MRWHFEKRGRLRLYRKIRIEGSALVLGFGMAGEEEVEVRIDYQDVGRYEGSTLRWLPATDGRPGRVVVRLAEGCPAEAVPSSL